MTVLFACVHNAGRSQIAAAWFNRMVDPRTARATSAGTHPAAHVHQTVVDAMREVGIDLSDVGPQRLTESLAAEAQWLITMGCGEECPVVPGVKRVDWMIADPAGLPLARVREIRDAIHAHVRSFVAVNGWALRD